MVSSPQAALEAAARSEFDLLIADLNYARDTTSGQEGLDLLARIPSVDPTLPVVVMTAWATVEVAVEAMRRGARDFIQSPGTMHACSQLSGIRSLLRRALRDGERLAAATTAQQGQGPVLIARSAAMRPVLS